MKPEALSTRLVVAAEEQDVLYMLYWLNEMKESGCLEQAINGKHSWKGCSALESIVQSPFSQLRRVILEVLLLQGADGQSQEIRKSAMKNENLEVLEILLTWKTSGRDSARDAQHLLSLSLEEAAEWIDQNLPPPPNAASLTGCGDLPQPPTTEELSTIQPESLMINLPESGSQLDSKPFALSPETTPLTPNIRSISPDYDSSQSYYASTRPSEYPSAPEPESDHAFLDSKRMQSFATSYHSRHAPLPDTSDRASSLDSSLTFREPSASASSSASMSTIDLKPKSRLNLSSLPIGFSYIDVKTLFAQIDVECEVVLCHTRYHPTYAFVDVPTAEVSLSIQSLYAKVVQGVKIVCRLD